MLIASTKHWSDSSNKRLRARWFRWFLRVCKPITDPQWAVYASRFLCVLVLTVASINLARADADNTPAIKTGFLYNFFRFIEWPNAGDSYRLCATTHSGLEAVLTSLDNKLVNNKPIKVLINVEHQALKNCDLVFIGPNENAPEINAILHGLAIVTVSDNHNFIEQGGMIELIEVDNRLAFALNLDTAKTAGVQISAQMLKLAKNVIATH